MRSSYATVAAAAFAGFLGGAISIRIFAPGAVEAAGPKTIQCDAKGVCQATELRVSRIVIAADPTSAAVNGISFETKKPDSSPPVQLTSAGLTLVLTDRTSIYTANYFPKSLTITEGNSANGPQTAIDANTLRLHYLDRGGRAGDIWIDKAGMAYQTGAPDQTKKVCFPTDSPTCK